jgi:hypothetical protein
MTDTDTPELVAHRANAVANAIKAGKIPLDEGPAWLARIKANPDAARHFDNMVPGFRPPSGNPVRHQLDTGTPPAPPPVERPTRDLALGGGLINMQAQLIGGKPHSEWSEQECRDAALWALGPRFRQGLKPPPEPQWFIPGESIQHTTNQEFDNYGVQT